MSGTAEQIGVPSRLSGIPAALPRPLTRGHVLAIGGLVLVGTGIRLWIARTNYGVTYDTDTATIVARLLTTHPLHAYTSLRYPYPPGYLPVLLACRWLADVTGQPFWALWKVPAILADAALAAVLVWGTGRLGAPPRTRVAVAALVALGPLFVIVSGFHGQLDSAAILPAAAAVVLWCSAGEGRAWQAGLLIGVGTAIKTLPLFMVLALLPTARSRREAATLIGCAVAVPLLCVLPFLMATPEATWRSLTFNHGVPGLGGLGVIAQPSLTSGWLHGRPPSASALTLWLSDKQNLIVGVAVLAAGAVAFVRRLEPLRAALLIWLVVYVANVNWAYQYFIWGLPFLLLAGYLWQAAALQALLLLPAAMMYFGFASVSLEWAYIPLVMLAWAAFAVGAATLLRRHDGWSFGPRRGMSGLRRPA